MYKNFLLILLSLTILPIYFVSRESSALAAQTIETDTGVVICPPALYDAPPDDCSPLGPSSTLTFLNETGITWPTRGLPAYPPDPALNQIPYRYYKVNESGTYVFGSMEDAATNELSGLRVGPGQNLYLAYRQRFDTESGVYFLLDNGGWIRGEGAVAALPYPFQGLLFSSTPRNSFGWIKGQTQSRTTPGYSGAYTGRVYYTFNVVQVYSEQVVDGATWVLINPDEWLEERVVSQVMPRTTSPEGIATPRWIEINLYEQTIAVYNENRLVFATAVSTGVDPFWTQPGIFSIYEKKETENMSGAFEADRSDYYYLENVPWTMYYDDKRALHGAYWHASFGYTTSHGCVNMSLGDSHWLYNWAHVGDVVYVFDPSGKTPIDTSLYGEGAP